MEIPGVCVVDKHVVGKNGVQIVNTAVGYDVYNDAFSSIPVFITTLLDGRLFLFSDFRDFYNRHDVLPKVDLAGFWEILLFGSCLHTRTLYHSVFQLPSASRIQINFEKKTFVIKSDWNFIVEENPGIVSMEQAALGLYERLRERFGEYSDDDKYIMGLSGGLDSRLSLAFLSQSINNLDTFTFGFSFKLYEAVQAVKVAQALKVKAPVFHKLTKNSYVQALDYLPYISGGQISINHCHMIDYFKNTEWDGRIQISNYFSDALFGFAAKSEKSYTRLEDTAEFLTLNKTNFLSVDIRDEIIDDLKKVYQRYDKSANFSSFNEFKYVVERNSKFHALLAFSQGRFIKTDLAYANFELLKYMLSVPLKFREHKAILDFVFKKFFKSVSTDKLMTVSSRGFKHCEKTSFSGRLNQLNDVCQFKICNASNSFLRKITGGKVQILNPFQTEELDRILYRDFRTILYRSSLELLQKQIISGEAVSFFNKIPFRGMGSSVRFSLISLATLLSDDKTLDS